MSSQLKKLKIISAAILLAVLCSCHSDKDKKEASTLPYYADATFTPVWLNATDSALISFHKIPAFNLVNQSGDVITEKTFEDKIYVTDFFFASCPGICPKMTANMIVIQEAFGNDDEVLLLSHSVTPRYDSAPVLREYASRHGIIDGKWHLATGDRSEIYSLGRNFYFVEEDLGIMKNTEDFLHTENFVLIDGNRHIRGIYNGLNKVAVNQLIDDIKTLKNEVE